MFRRKSTSNMADYTYVNGMGFLPISKKQKEKKVLDFLLSCIIVSFLFYMCLRTVLQMPVLTLLRFLGTDISVNPNTGLMAVSQTALLLSNFIVYIISMAITGVLLHLLSRKISSSSVTFSLPAASMFWPCLFMLLGAVLVAQYASIGFSYATGNIGIVFIDEATTYLLDSNVAMVLYLCSAIFLPAVLEELLYRGILLQCIRRFGNIFAILLTSTIYALMQSSVDGMIYSFMFSVPLCFVALRPGGIWICMTANFISRCYFVGHGLLEKVIEFNAFFIYGGSFIVLLLALVSFYYYTGHHDRAFRLAADESLLTNREKSRRLFGNIGFWALVALALFTTLSHVEFIN